MTVHYHHKPLALLLTKIYSCWTRNVCILYNIFKCHCVSSLWRFVNNNVKLDFWSSLEHIFLMVLVDADMGGHPKRIGLGQRPCPMLSFVLSRPKGLDKQSKYGPRMEIWMGQRPVWVLGSLRSPRTQTGLWPIQISILGPYFLGSLPCPHRRGP